MNEITIIDDEITMDIMAVPSVSGILISAAKTFANHIARTREESFLNFNRDLFSDYKVASEEEREKLLNLIKITIKEYELLMTAAMEDEDKRKDKIYCNTYKHILKNREKLDESKIMQLLRISKTFPYSAIKLLPPIYVHKYFTILETNIDLYLRGLRSNPNILYETNLLIQHGLIIENGERISLTNLLKEITEIFFKDTELTPEALNLKPKEKRAKMIILSNLENTKDEMQLKNLLSQAKVDVKEYLHFHTKPNGIIQNIIYLFEKEPLNEKIINTLRTNIRENNNIVKVTFYKETIDPIPDIGNKLIYIDLENQKSKKDFINSFEIR